MSVATATSLRYRLLTIDDLLDTSRYVKVADVPVLDEHDHPTKGKIDKDLLKLIAENTNERCDQGNYRSVLIGHTFADEDVEESRQPISIGVATNFKVKEFRGKPCLYCDWYIEKDHVEDLKTYPHRSVERVRSDKNPEFNYIDSIAVLRRAPQRDLGRLVAYARSLPSGATSESYAMPQQVSAERSIVDRLGHLHAPTNLRVPGVDKPYRGGEYIPPEIFQRMTDAQKRMTLAHAKFDPAEIENVIKSGGSYMPGDQQGDDADPNQAEGDQIVQPAEGQVQNPISPIQPRLSAIDAAPKAAKLFLKPNDLSFLVDEAAIQRWAARAELADSGMLGGDTQKIVDGMSEGERPAMLAAVRAMTDWIEAGCPRGEAAVQIAVRAGQTARVGGNLAASALTVARSLNQTPLESGSHGEVRERVEAEVTDPGGAAGAGEGGRVTAPPGPGGSPEEPFDGVPASVVRSSEGGTGFGLTYTPSDNYKEPEAVRKSREEHESSRKAIASKPRTRKPAPGQRNLFGGNDQQLELFRATMSLVRYAKGGDIDDFLSNHAEIKPLIARNAPTHEVQAKIQEVVGRMPKPGGATAPPPKPPTPKPAAAPAPPKPPPAAAANPGQSRPVNPSPAPAMPQKQGKVTPRDPRTQGISGGKGAIKPVGQPDQSPAPKQVGNVRVKEGAQAPRAPMTGTIRPSQPKVHVGAPAPASPGGKAVHVQSNLTAAEQQALRDYTEGRSKAMTPALQSAIAKSNAATARAQQPTRHPRMSQGAQDAAADRMFPPQKPRAAAQAPAGSPAPAPSKGRNAVRMDLKLTPEEQQALRDFSEGRSKGMTPALQSAISKAQAAQNPQKKPEGPSGKPAPTQQKPAAAGPKPLQRPFSGAPDDAAEMNRKGDWHVMRRGDKLVVAGVKDAKGQWSGGAPIQDARARSYAEGLLHKKHIPVGTDPKMARELVAGGMNVVRHRGGYSVVGVRDDSGEWHGYSPEEAQGLHERAMQRRGVTPADKLAMTGKMPPELAAQMRLSDAGAKAAPGLSELRAKANQGPFGAMPTRLPTIPGAQPVAPPQERISPAPPAESADVPPVPPGQARTDPGQTPDSPAQARTDSAQAPDSPGQATKQDLAREIRSLWKQAHAISYGHKDAKELNDPWLRDETTRRLNAISARIEALAPEYAKFGGSVSDLSGDAKFRAEMLQDEQTEATPPAESGSSAPESGSSSGYRQGSRPTVQSGAGEALRSRKANKVYEDTPEGRLSRERDLRLTSVMDAMDGDNRAVDLAKLRKKFPDLSPDEFSDMVRAAADRGYLALGSHFDPAKISEETASASVQDSKGNARHFAFLVDRVKPQEPGEEEGGQTAMPAPTPGPDNGPSMAPVAPPEPAAAPEVPTDAQAAAAPPPMDPQAEVAPEAGPQPEAAPAATGPRQFAVKRDPASQARVEAEIAKGPPAESQKPDRFAKRPAPWERPLPETAKPGEVAGHLRDSLLYLWTPAGSQVPVYGADGKPQMMGEGESQQVVTKALDERGMIGSAMANGSFVTPEFYDRVRNAMKYTGDLVKRLKGTPEGANALKVADQDGLRDRVRSQVRKLQEALVEHGVADVTEDGRFAGYRPDYFEAIYGDSLNREGNLRWGAGMGGPRWDAIASLGWHPMRDEAESMANWKAPAPFEEPPSTPADKKALLQRLLGEDESPMSTLPETEAAFAEHAAVQPDLAAMPPERVAQVAPNEATGKKAGLAPENYDTFWDSVAADPNKKDGYVGPLDTSLIDVDPDRFQFRMEATGKFGTAQRLAGVEKWNPKLAGVIQVWRDPADNKTYVVNGHHRVEKAKSFGFPWMNVMFIEAKDAADARIQGAMTNIAEGSAKPYEVAKLFRDMRSQDRDDSEILSALEQSGVSVKGQLADQGLAISRLPNGAFKDAINGTLENDVAVAIGKSGLDPEQMQFLATAMVDRREAGKRTDADVVKRMARKVAQSTTREETGLLPGMESHFNDMYELVEVEDEMDTRLNRRALTFSMAGNQDRARIANTTEGGGVQVDPEVATRVGRQWSMVRAVINASTEMARSEYMEPIRAANKQVRDAQKSLKGKSLASRLGEIYDNLIDTLAWTATMDPSIAGQVEDIHGFLGKKAREARL